MDGRLPRAVRSRMRAADLRAERGGVLVEVIVSAVLVVMVATAVFRTLDAAAGSSGQEKSRAAAATLVQQDQDRLHGMDPSKLSTFSSTRTVTVDTVTYTVTSSAVYVADTSGATSCTASTTGNGADYLRVTSTVTWPNIGSRKPVTANSIVTPRNGVFTGTGSVVVKILDRDSQPEANVPVQITSPDVLTVNTNSAGCAFFGNLTPGTKVGKVSLPGYVDPAGNATIAQNWTSTANQLTAYTYQYDQSATVNLSFDTQVGATVSPTTADSVTFVNSGVNTGTPPPATSGKLVIPISPAATTAQITGLFPFTNGYTVYAGNCAGASPPISPTNYLPSVATDPGGSNSLTVREPSINVTTQRNGTNQATRVLLKQTGSGCSTVYDLTTTSAGILIAGASPFSQGFPYGSYSVCADDSNTQTTVHNRVGTAVTLNTPTGSSSQTLNVTSTSGSGKCT